jgi:hypothetical protein
MNVVAVVETATARVLLIPSAIVMRIDRPGLHERRHRLAWRRRSQHDRADQDDSARGGEDDPSYRHADASHPVTRSLSALASNMNRRGETNALVTAHRLAIHRPSSLVNVRNSRLALIVSKAGGAISWPTAPTGPARRALEPFGPAGSWAMGDRMWCGHRARTVHPGSERMTQRRYDGRDQDGARRHRPPSRRRVIFGVVMIVASMVLTMVVATLLAAGW